MTALIAPVRAASFEGLIFFVYDREAVKKEADPPENAIIYFYPPSASIEDRISVCGQLVGMSQFMHGFLNARPALCKLHTEKVATVHSGKYTLALGGSLSEPDSLLITQLETLHSTFTFYHGSLERIRMMCESQNMFLTWMNVIWDCYLHFIRHYGDFLPGVFDPLPFLDLPKSVAATCFTKASYILQACQRRQHVLGGCILYHNSILCTQLEPSITERLLLLKPNQSNHPARPVKTEFALPFGVRILNAFLTLSEYLNLYDALAESAYRQPLSRGSSGTFPDMYTTSSSSTLRDSPSGRQSDAKDDGHSNDELPQVSSDISANSNEGLGFGSSGGERNAAENSAKGVASATPSDTTEGPKGDSTVAEQRESSNQLPRNESSVTLEMETSSMEESDETVRTNEQDVGTIAATEEGNEITVNKIEQQNESATSTLAEKKAEEESADPNEGSRVDEVGATRSNAVFDSSSTESTLSTDTSLTMEAIDVVGLKVVEYSSSQREEQQYGEGKDKTVPCSTSPQTLSNDELDMYRLILDDLITQAVEIAHKESSRTNEKSVESVTDPVACCQACVDSRKSSDVPCGDSPCQSERKRCEVKTNKPLTNGNFSSVEQILGKDAVAAPPDIRETNPPSSDCSFCDEENGSRPSNTADVAENGVSTDVTPNKVENSLRSELIKTPIVCDSFSIRNLNVGSEKFLEKSFACVNTSTDLGTRDSQVNVGNNASQNANSISKDLVSNGLTVVSDGFPVVESIDSVEPDSEIYITNGHEGISLTEGIDTPVDLALEEVEEELSPEWFEPPLGDVHCLPDLGSEELLLFEEGGDDVNQVEGLTHVNLYVQAHSKVVLILLAEEGLNNDCNSIKSLWETSLNQLGELEFLVKQSSGDESIPVHSDEYSFLVYDSFERNMKGNLDELVYQVDHSFCETTKLLHEQFENCSTLKDVTLRNRSSTVYGKRNLGRGTYFHLKGYRTGHTIPLPRDPIFQLERRASNVLHKEHGVNVF